jgi:drug/metabolite transporter (DMT)-like permease
MPLGDVNMIGSSSTFFTCVYARIFLKEKLHLGHFINIGIVIGGIMLIVQVKVNHLYCGFISF